MPCCNNSCASNQNRHLSPQYKKVLWIALIVNFTMFIVEIVMGISAGSVSLLSDSLDFLGDSANYVISLIVLPMALSWRAKASMLKGLTMGSFGLFILFTTIYQWFNGKLPDYAQMSAVGVLALFANVWVAWLLYRFRDGDSNMQSVWLCSRNDAIGNLAVVGAGVAVYFTNSKYPDLLVAFVLAFLAISAAVTIIRQAWRELKTISNW
ncbi:cation diffusion facilitator family transporter [Mannheimia bovis]|uniref:Cation transporter n=1 Tax=Mannheimia bovis TaxID=2770636 RepID=A0A7H1C0J6_9PAST|nr:cation diffusion facilitator family transporter [Mannheimia bovis]QNS14501.1 cation transporter [Mannheimia bovis]